MDRRKTHQAPDGYEVSCQQNKCIPYSVSADQFGEGFLGKPTLKQVLNALERQLLIGKTYLSIAKGLLQAEPGVFNTAPTFFGLMFDGSLELAQMTVARLYDRERHAVTIRTMLVQAGSQRGDRKQVLALIAKSETIVLGLKPVLIAISHRRNEWLAHLGQQTVSDPQALAAKARLTIPDLDRAFEETEKILMEFTRLFDGRVGPIRFSGDDDYKAVLDHIRRSMAAQKKELDVAFEAQFGHPPLRS